MKRLSGLVMTLLLLTGCRLNAGTPPPAKPVGQRVTQVVHDFRANWAEKWITVDGKRLDGNPFFRFTHFCGGDWGRMGPSESQLLWRDGALCAGTPQRPTTDWSGAWFSLAGLAREDHRRRDLRALYPSWVKPGYQPKVVALALDLAGQGLVKVELKGPNSAPTIRWKSSRYVNSERVGQYRFAVNAGAIGKVKFLNVVFEPGAALRLDRLALELEFGDLPLSERTFLYSYAKTAASYDPASGLCADRAHWAASDFSSVSATGLCVLATAAGADLGFLDREAARQMLRRTQKTMASVKRGPAGLLPHFVENRDGAGWVISPGTEWSTVDGALYWESCLLASRILGEAEAYTTALREVRALDFDKLYTAENYITHGFTTEGARLQSHWGDFGGETALCILLARLNQGNAARAKMDANGGRVFRGVGFIAGIASLLFPQFSAERPEAVTGINWQAARKRLLRDQLSFFSGTAAGRLGIIGLSAGEGPNGVGYLAQGPDEVLARLIHPHEVLLTALLREHPADVYSVLGRMQARSLFSPLGGLVENLDPDNPQATLPMLSTLNGSMESLASLHLLCHVTGRPDPIYRAAREAPELREAVAVFYPGQ